MELSNYLKVFPAEEHPDYVLLFSTKQFSKILLEKTKYQALLNGGLPADDDTCATLAKNGMLVTDREQEKKSLPVQLEALHERNKVLQVIIVLNLDCNFACPYCFEGNRKGDYYMSEETREQVVEFIKKNLTPKIKILRVVFYGGEPLLSLGFLKSFAQSLKTLADAAGVTFTFNLVTNGSLLYSTVARALKPLGLKGAQITLDGPAGLHNRSRPLRSGKGSFATVVDNIHDCCDLVDIGIGGNYTDQTYAQFPELLDYLVATGITPEKVAGIRFAPIAKLREGEAAVPDFNEGCLSIDEPWLLKADLFLREQILKRGYRTPPLAPGLCMIEAKDAYVINYDGAMYKCPGFLGKQGFEIGDVKNGLRDYAEIYKVGCWKKDECRDCSYLPLCYGGCRYMTYIRRGKIDGIECKRAYFDASLEKLVKMDVKYGGKRTGSTAEKQRAAVQ